MRLRESNVQELKAQNRALRKLVYGNKSEKITVDPQKTAEASAAGEASKAGAAAELQL